MLDICECKPWQWSPNFLTCSLTMLFLRVIESLFICKKQKLKMKAELKTAKGPVSLTGEPTGEIGNYWKQSCGCYPWRTYANTPQTRDRATDLHRCMPCNHLLVKKIFIVGFCLFVCLFYHWTCKREFIFTATELSVAMTHGNKVLSQTCRDSRWQSSEIRQDAFQK